MKAPAVLATHETTTVQDTVAEIEGALRGRPTCKHAEEVMIGEGSEA
jgi:hypothetical protein